MSNFHTILKQLRKGAKMTQPELADKLGISRSAVSMYEAGAREPDFETLEDIADLFNVDMNTLIGSENLDSLPFKPPTDDDIKFALFGGRGEITDAMYDEVKNFASFVKKREESKRKKG